MKFYLRKNLSKLINWLSPSSLDQKWESEIRSYKKWIKTKRLSGAKKMKKMLLFMKIFNSKKNNQQTTYYGGELSCGHDYFELIRYRLEQRFANAFKMLDETCTNSRGQPTGNEYSSKLKLIFYIISKNKYVYIYRIHENTL